MLNEDAIHDYLIDAGMPAIPAYGIMGNILIESNGDPAAVNQAEGAIGICQWEGGRRTALDKYASLHGKGETDLTMQLEYLVIEAKARGNWDEMAGMTGVDNAAGYWDQYFEVSAGTSRGARIEAAEAFYRHYQTNLPPSPTLAPAPPGFYRVISGDTLSGIGEKTGVDWHRIYDINRQIIGPNPDLIYPGQMLRLTPPEPAPAPTPPGPGVPVPTHVVPAHISYTVVAGDTLSEIGEKYGISYMKIAADNGITNPDLIYPGQVLVLVGGHVPAAAPPPRTYTVIEGDTLSGIGEKTGIPWQEIYAKNKGVIGDNPDLIYPGQVYTL